MSDAGRRPPSIRSMAPEAFVDALIEWLEAAGATRYDEVVSQAEHALQCAALAREAGSSDTLVAATLLHDVGHLLMADVPRDERRARDLRHEVVGARWLERAFGPGVADPVRLHVSAKRYLCANEPEYWNGLSAASKQSLELQGDAMTAEECRQFEASEPRWRDGVALRRFDDLGKVAGRSVPGLETYARTLTELVSA